MKKEVSEEQAVKKLRKYIEDRIDEKYIVEEHKCLQYYCSGIIPLKNAISEQSRKEHYFQTDLLIYENDKDKGQIPRVVIEVKCEGFSSHDVITYASKAEKHKILYPYLQYGFVVCGGKEDSLANRFLYHGDKFDFAVILKEFNRKDKYTDDFLYNEIIEPAIQNSIRMEKLTNMMNDKHSQDKFFCFRKDFILPMK